MNKPLLKGRFKVDVCPHVRFDCHTKILLMSSASIECALTAPTLEALGT